jgi:hypothetical protein
MRIIVLGTALLMLSGCLNWQAGYDHAAREECRKQSSDDVARCLAAVEANARKQAAEHTP